MRTQHRWTPAEARRAALIVADKRVERAKDHARRYLAVSDLVDELGAENIGPTLIGASLVLVNRVLSDDLPEPENALDALRYAETAKVLFTMGRLASGQSTSNVLSASVDPASLAQRLANLEALTTRQGPTRTDTPASPVDDAQPTDTTG